MKLVIINEVNHVKIMKAFRDAQHKATARTIDSFKELLSCLDDIDKRLGKMPKNAKNGTKVEWNFQQHFSGAYKYRPDSTHFDLVFEKGSWRIDVDSICRYTCPNNSRDYYYNLYLSDTAKEWILSQYA